MHSRLSRLVSGCRRLYPHSAPIPVQMQCQACSGRVPPSTPLPPRQTASTHLSRSNASCWLPLPPAAPPAAPAAACKAAEDAVLAAPAPPCSAALLSPPGAALLLLLAVAVGER